MAAPAPVYFLDRLLGRTPSMDAAMAAQGSPGANATEGQIALDIPIRGTKLVQLAETERFGILDRRESYFRKQQHAAKLYDWDGNFAGFSAESPVKPGYVVPYKARRPANRYHLAYIIVSRFTSMLFGVDRFPEVTVPGDQDAEAFLKAMIKEARLPMRMAEARDLGGSTGTGCLSFAFVRGKPRVEVHNSKHCTVLRWADEAERRPAAVIKTYAYPRRVWDEKNKKTVTVTYYSARYWDEEMEISWAPIPKSVAMTDRWFDGVQKKVVQHGYGFCPFYWIQNTPDSVDPDGEGDYEGLEDDFDEIDQLLAATTKGTKANVDPTLVVHMDPVMNNGSLKKGSENAIFSKDGAEYLELKGQAVTAAKTWLDELRTCALESACVVLPDAQKLTGAAQSAQALRILFAPMLARADVFREQYGEFGIIPIARDMLRAARLILSSPAVEDGVTGEALQATVVLPPRMVAASEAGAKPDGGPPEMKAMPHVPGTSEDVTLNWNPYFSPTWKDITDATTAAKTANGGKPVITQRTSISALASLWNVTDVDKELHELHEQAEADLEAAQTAFEAGGPQPELRGGKPGEKPPTGKDEKGNGNDASEE